MSSATEVLQQVRSILDASIGVALDFDGVLADSEEFQLNIWKEIFREKQLPLSGLSLETVAGRLDEVLIRSVLSDQTEATYEELIRDKQRRCVDMYSDLKPVPGAQEFFA